MTSKKKIIISFVVVLATLTMAVSTLGACSQVEPGTTSPTTSSDPADKVEVTFFYESDNCFCLDLAVQWVNTVMDTDYRSQQDSGKLVYHSYDVREPSTQPIMEEYNASKFALFVTSIKGSQEDTWPVSKIWMYTDSSGTNQELKSKFVGELKKNIDRALGIS